VLKRQKGSISIETLPFWLKIALGRYGLADKAARVALALPFDYGIVHPCGKLCGFPLETYESTLVVKVLREHRLA